MSFAELVVGEFIGKATLGRFVPTRQSPADVLREFVCRFCAPAYWRAVVLFFA